MLLVNDLPGTIDQGELPYPHEGKTVLVLFSHVLFSR